MRIGVTGGMGFIGSHLCKALRKQGHLVTSFDNYEKFPHEYSVTNINVDLRNIYPEENWFDVFDCVIHLAGKVGSYDVYKDQAMEILKANTLIDQNVLNCVVANGVRKYIYISSSHVYPNIPKLLTEETEPDPDLTYGMAKVIGEHAALKMHSNATVLRLIGIYGPGSYLDDKIGSIIPALCQRLVEGDKYFIKTSGEEERSFCYIDDAVEAICKIVDTNCNYPGKVFNVGKQEKISILRLAFLLSELVEAERPVNYHWYNKADLYCQWCDCSKIKEAIGWEATTSLDVGLKATYEDIERRLKSE